VMDGDLQHPPELIPEMITAAITGDHDMVVASRYCRTGGSAGGLSSGTRRLVSSGATLVSRVLFPRLVGRVSDPMSGFFAIRRGAIDPWRLRPEGFKILLELLVRTPPRSIRELPFVFADRRCGISKASCREGARYVRQLVRLRCASWSGGPVSRGRQVVRLVASLWSFG
jgi:dolichol-phosphate mannosyltransferase